MRVDRQQECLTNGCSFAEGGVCKRIEAFWQDYDETGGLRKASLREIAVTKLTEGIEDCANRDSVEELANFFGGKDSSYQYFPEKKT